MIRKCAVCSKNLNCRVEGRIPETKVCKDCQSCDVDEATEFESYFGYCEDCQKVLSKFEILAY